MKVKVATYLLMFSLPLYAQFFENIAPQQGIEHTVNTNLLFGGHGVAFFDFNQDGWDDITFVQENDSIVLYLNNEGVFQKVQGVEHVSGETRQALWVDYDNDGDYDLFVTATNGLARLYENDGQFNFNDVTLQAGLSTFNANNYGASFADYDNDGYLDLYIARYTMEGSLNNPNHLNVLYKNNGDGTFTDVTSIAGVGDSLQPSFMGVWIDINYDNYPDLYVINDRVLWGNSLYLNNGDGTFTDYTAPSGLSMFGEDPMGAMVADFDNDGDLDILLSNGGPPTKPPRFYINNGDSTFFENAAHVGIDVPVTFMCTWGGTWFDMDNDSFLDMYLTTGLLMPASDEVRNYLFHNNNATHFIDSPQLFDYDHIAASYAVAKGDIDNDGYADLVVQNAKQFNSFIWKNNYGPSTGNNFVKVTLEGTVSNKMAIGSWIKVYFGSTVLHHYTRCGENFISQDSQHHIFGLKNATVIDSVEVLYQSGHIDKYYNLPVNEHYYFKEGETLNASLNYTGNGVYCMEDSTSVSVQLNSTNDAVLWSTGDTLANIFVTVSDLYFAQITSEHGIIYFSDTIQITFNTPPLIVPTVNNPNCFGENTGSIALDIFPSQGAAPSANVIWSNGDSGFMVDSLFEGVYYFDYFGLDCFLSDTIELSAPSEIDIIYFVSPIVNGSAELEVFAFGGVSPYTFLIDSDTVLSFPILLQTGSYNCTIIDDNNCQKDFTILIENAAALDEKKPNLKIITYPNPAKNNVNVQIPENIVGRIERLQIFDTNGKRVLEINSTELMNNSILELDFSVFPTGQYILILDTFDGVSASAKIVKVA